MQVPTGRFRRTGLVANALGPTLAVPVSPLSGGRHCAAGWESSSEKLCSDGPGSGLPEKKTPNSPWDACHGRRAPLNGMRHCDAAAFFGG